MNNITIKHVFAARNLSDQDTDDLCNDAASGYADRLCVALQEIYPDADIDIDWHPAPSNNPETWAIDGLDEDSDRFLIQHTADEVSDKGDFWPAA